MKKVSVLVWGIILSLAILSGTAYAADKFAYVDLAKIFSEYSKTKDYDKIINDKKTAYEAERDKKVNEIKQFEDKMNLLSDKEKEAKQKDLEAKIKDFQDFDRQKITDLKKEAADKENEIVKDITDAVKQLSEKEGYTMVFLDRVLIYQDKNLDITDKIVEIVNKGTKATKK